MQPRAPRRQLSIGDPVLMRDYRKSHNPWTKGVIISKLGPVTYHIQVDDFIWKQRITPNPLLKHTQAQEPVPEATSAEDFPEDRKPAAKSLVKPPQGIRKRILSFFTNRPIQDFSDHCASKEPKKKQLPKWILRFLSRTTF